MAGSYLRVIKNTLIQTPIEAFVNLLDGNDFFQEPPYIYYTSLGT